MTFSVAASHSLTFGYSPVTPTLESISAKSFGGTVLGDISRRVRFPPPPLNLYHVDDLRHWMAGFD